MTRKLKIAVCLYGQPRQLEYVSTYIKKYYDNDNYDIDFFCSAKSYYEWFSDKRKLEHTSIENEDDILEKIKSVYNPKSISIIPTELDSLHDYDKIQKVHLSLVDSILLKSQYEAIHNVQYDITILQRYDSIIFPLQKTLDFAIDSLIKSKSFTNPNHVFYFKMGNYNKKGNMIKMVQDIAFFSIGNTFDILAAELLTYVGKWHEKLLSENRSAYFIMNIHSLIYDIFSKNNVEMHEFDNSTAPIKINVTIIRDGLEHLDILDSNSWDRYVKLWNETQK